MIDQRVSEGIQSNFFNKKALTTKIPAQLVKRFNIPIVPVYIERIKGINFKIYISPPINFSKNSTIQSITDELNLKYAYLVSNYFVNIAHSFSQKTCMNFSRKFSLEACQLPRLIF